MNARISDLVESMYRDAVRLDLLRKKEREKVEQMAKGSQDALDGARSDKDELLKPAPQEYMVPADYNNPFAGTVPATAAQKAWKKVGIGVFPEKLPKDTLQRLVFDARITQKWEDIVDAEEWLKHHNIDYGLP